VGDSQLSTQTSNQQGDALRFQRVETPGVGMAYLSSTRWLSSIFVLGVFSVLIGVGCLTVGAHPISFETVLQTLGAAIQGGSRETESTGVSGMILMQVRFPRTVLAFLVGGSLAAVGVGLQALLRNP